MNTLLKPLDQYSQKELGAVEDDEMAHPFRPYTDISPTDSRPGSADGSIQTASAAQIITDETGPVNDAAVNSDPNHRLNDSHISLESSDSAGSTMQGSEDDRVDHSKTGFEGWRLRMERRARRFVKKYYTTTRNNVNTSASKTFQTLPQPVQKALTKVWWAISKTVSTIGSFLNVPLCAIIISVLVGSVPALKAFFYTPGSFVNNTFTSAVEQLGGVAVPLILFVLGGNLNKSTLPSEDTDDPAYSSDKKKMLFCSLMSRMLIPLLLMAPVLAIMAKFVPISILDDPIFIIVCFLLTGAPSALQLAQICQVNNVYVPVIAKLLVHSYVIWYVCQLSKLEALLTAILGSSLRR
jgi:predicted permease